jgi:TrmH family RNA methyltransferase
MHSRTISSLQHPLVKHLVKLRQSREYRHACRKIVLSGVKLIKELSSQFRLRTLLLEEDTMFLPKAEGIVDQIFCVTKEILKKVTGLENPEPVAAEIDMPLPGNLSNANFLLILDGVSDPGNLGTLLRTALALGWDGAYLTPGSTDPFNEKAIRAAKGATFTFPWKSGTWEELSLLLRDKKMTVIAADASGDDLAHCKVVPPIALALGNEAHGLNPELKEIAKWIAIPMQKTMESLNVATAGAIFMYELKGRPDEQR